MNLVEEEDLAFAEVGEDGGEVALDLEGGAGGLLEADVELVGDDGGEGGFAEAGGTGEEDVVEGFAAGFGGFEGDGELLFGFGLADELSLIHIYPERMRDLSAVAAGGDLLDGCVGDRGEDAECLSTGGDDV